MVWLLSLILLLVAVWAVLRFLPAGVEGRLPLPYLIAMTPFLWIPALACAVVAGVLSHWWVCAVAGVETVALLALQAPYWRHRCSGTWLESLFRRRPADADGCTAPSDGTADSDAPDAYDVSGAPDVPARAGAAYRCPVARFTVMTLNCRYGRASAEAIVTAVRTRSVAVLALQELSRELVEELEANGLSLLLPHRQLGQERPTDNGGFNGVWTRFIPEDMRSSAVDIPAADVPSITAAFPQPVPEYEIADDDDPAGQAESEREGTVVVTFASAHPKSPMRGCREWSDGIIGLGALAHVADGDPAGRARHPQAIRYDGVVLGDLNSGLHHPSFRRLLAQGFRDAALSVAQGATTTFPSWLPWPRIELDHVLSTPGITAGHVESFVVEGSDHLALAASLVVRP